MRRRVTVFRPLSVRDTQHAGAICFSAELRPQKKKSDRQRRKKAVPLSCAMQTVDNPKRLAQEIVRGKNCHQPPSPPVFSFFFHQQTHSSFLGPFFSTRHPPPPPATRRFTGHSTHRFIPGESNSNQHPASCPVIRFPQKLLRRQIRRSAAIYRPPHLHRFRMKMGRRGQAFGGRQLPVTKYMKEGAKAPAK